MQFKKDSKAIAKRAWSIRLMIVAAIMSGAEIVLPFFSEVIPRNLFAALSFVAVSGAFVARFIVQRGLDGDE